MEYTLMTHCVSQYRICSIYSQTEKTKADSFESAFGPMIF